MQNLRFRERGPFKTWRPETMAEAIMAVLREGLSLSQVISSIIFLLLVLYADHCAYRFVCRIRDRIFLFVCWLVSFTSISYRGGY